jgi:oxygen-independent coproporphyrinogen-3 oxidase
VAALERELEWVAPGTPLSQLFVGGGTPTALPADLLDRVLGAVFERMSRHGNHVHVVEASPETITPGHLEVLERRSIGRVSMGIQSLDAPVLSAVRRGHGSATALDAVRMIVASGRILNVDLMYGLPGQSEDSFRSDFARLADAGVHSLTCYDLRLSNTTPVAKRLTDDEWLSVNKLIRWREAVRETAAETGFIQTRWHTFKRPDALSMSHERAPCNTPDGYGYQLGIGLSARSHIGRTIYRNIRGFEGYLGRVEAGESPVEDIFSLDEVGRKTQYVARSLGDGHHLDQATYRAAFGVTLEHDYGSVLERLVRAGALDRFEAGYRLSEAGKLVYDLVTLAFYPEPIKDWLRARENPAFAIAVPASNGSPRQGSAYQALAGRTDLVN